jgi:hypothetical protein
MAKQKVDKNENARNELAKKILEGNEIKSFSRILKLDSVNELDKITPGISSDHKWKVSIYKNNTLISGHGKTKLDAVIHCITHLETMGFYFEEFTYTPAEAPELFKSGNIVKELINETTGKTKPPVKAAKKMKCLPFL